MANEEFLAWEKAQGYTRSPIANPWTKNVPIRSRYDYTIDEIARKYSENYRGLSTEERMELSLLQDVPMPLFKHMLQALPLDEYCVLWGNCKEDVPHVEPIAVTFFVSHTEPSFTHSTSSMIWYDLGTDKLFLKREDEPNWTEATRYYTVWNHTTV